VSRLRSVELRRGKQVSGVRRRKAQGARHKAQFLHCPPFLKVLRGDFTTPLLHYSNTPSLQTIIKICGSGFPRPPRLSGPSASAEASRCRAGSRPARLALLAWRAWWRAGSRDSSFRKPPQARLRRGIQGSRPEDARLPARLRPVGDYAPEDKAYSSERRTFILFALAPLPSSLKLRRDKPLSPAPQAASATSGFPVSQSAVGGFMNYPGYAQDLPRDEGSLSLSSP
jgi:hypothetical protein